MGVTSIIVDSNFYVVDTLYVLNEKVERDRCFIEVKLWITINMKKIVLD